MGCTISWAQAKICCFNPRIPPQIVKTKLLFFLPNNLYTRYFCNNFKTIKKYEIKLSRSILKWNWNTSLYNVRTNFQGVARGLTYLTQCFGEADRSTRSSSQKTALLHRSLVVARCSSFDRVRLMVLQSSLKTFNQFFFGLSRGRVKLRFIENPKYIWSSRLSHTQNKPKIG